MVQTPVNIEVRDPLGNLISVGDTILGLFPSDHRVYMREGTVLGFWERDRGYGYGGEDYLMEVEWTRAVSRGWSFPSKPTKIEINLKRFIKFPGWAEGYPQQ